MRLLPDAVFGVSTITIFRTAVAVAGAAVVLLGFSSSAAARMGDPVEMADAKAVATPVEPEDVWTADVNRDGRDDLLVRCADGSLVVMLGGQTNAAIAFTRSQALRVPDGTGIISPPTVADFDGDGKLDILIAVRPDPDADAGRLYFFSGNGDGTFGGIVTAAELEFCPAYDPDSTQPRPAAMPFGDFNGDGKLDVLLIERDLNPVRRDSTVVRIMRGKGDGTFQPPEECGLNGLVGAAPMVVADFNCDRRPDVAVGEDVNLPQRVFLGDGMGRFRELEGSAPAPSSATDPFEPIYSIATGDMNGDKIPDLVIGSLGQMWVLQGRGDGTFETKDVCKAVVPPWLLELRDMNKDGKLDVVTNGGSASYGGGVLTPLFVKGTGKGTLAPAWTMEIATLSSYGYGGRMAALMRGKARAAAIARSGSSRRYGYSTTSFSLGRYTLDLSNQVPEKCVIGDFNGDGGPDFALLGLNRANTELQVRTTQNLTGIDIFNRYGTDVYVVGGLIVAGMALAFGICLWYFRPGPSMLRESAISRQSFPPPVRSSPETYD